MELERTFQEEEAGQSDVARAAILKQRRVSRRDELMRSGEHSALTENDWWSRVVIEDSDGWSALDELPSLELAISVDEVAMLEEVDLASRDNLDEDGFKTMPGLLVEESDELLWMILSAARENPEAHCLELVDAELAPFAELIVDRGRVCCGIFLERQLMLEHATKLAAPLRLKLEEMAACAFEDAPWLTAGAWDWSEVELNLHQRHALAMLTAHALTEVLRSPRARSASIRSHPIELKPDVLLSFSPVELSLSMDAFLDHKPIDEPAKRFFEAHAHRALRGGLLRRDDRMPGALRPTRMIHGGELTYQDKRALRLAAEEQTLLHAQIGFKDKAYVHICSATEEGFWVLLSTEERVAMLRFPKALMGLVYGDALRLLHPQEESA